MKSSLKLGTRKSILARVQSEWVASELQKKNQNLKIELIGIETKGDMVLDVPLQEVEGKDFFVAELDRALISGEVDFTVHSLKDLSLDRPLEIFTVAIPKREPSHDVIVFHERIFESLKLGKSIRIGSSSPRRQETIPRFLKVALPYLGSEPVLEFASIRGNVNTRLKKLNEGFDGVVLALAGLNRLWSSDEGQYALTPLLENTRQMVLPLSICPSAPGQGALSVECRTNDSETKKILSSLHSAEAAHEVKLEREILKKYGGGCHQRFGASVLDIPGLQNVLSVQGKSERGEKLSELIWDKSNLPEAGWVAEEVWDGKLARLESETEYLVLSKECVNGLVSKKSSVFISHSRALEQIPPESIQGRVYTAGIETWKHLAKRGVFVEGCSEGFGWDSFKSLRDSPVLRLSKDWLVYTHEGAISDWKGVKVFATYRIDRRDFNESEKDTLSHAKILFWASGTQFGRLKSLVNPEATHCTGPGKTSQALRKHGIEPTIFPTRNEWLSWVGRKT